MLGRSEGEGGCRMHDSRSKMQDPRCRIQDAGLGGWIEAHDITIYGTRDKGRIQDAGSKKGAQRWQRRKVTGT